MINCLRIAVNPYVVGKEIKWDNKRGSLIMKIKHGISFVISFMMILSMLSICPVKAETLASEGVSNNAPSQKDIVDYLKSHDISKDYEDTFATPFTTRESKSSYDVSDAGALSDDSQQKALTYLNTMRYIAGVDPVQLSDDLKSQAQCSAYVNYLNDKMTHYPAKTDAMSQELYAKAENGSKNGNLGFSAADYEPYVKSRNMEDEIDGWLSDSNDEDNWKVLGHRRWSLDPKLTEVGFGKAYGVRRNDSSWYSEHATMTYAYDKRANKSQKGLSWPAAQMPVGFFNNKDVWSYLSVDGLKDNNITVTLTRTKSSDGAGQKTWTMTKTANDDGVVYTDYEIREGYSISNLVGHTDAVIFNPHNMDIHAGDVYNVKITGVGKTVDYDVSFFDPDHVSSESNPVTKINLDQSILDSDNHLALTEGDSYDLSKHISIEPEDADNPDLSYSSSDETVATCTNGTIDALSAGETKITVKSDNDVTLTVLVKVTANEPAPTVSVPKGKTYTYDGEEHGVILPDHVVYADDQYSDKKATDAGNYVYYVKPEDGYTWEDGSTDDQSVEWSISKADNSVKTFDVDDVTYPDQPEVHVQLKYLDDEKEIEYKKNDADDDDYTTDVPSKPGTYTVRVSSEGSENVNAFEETKTFTIQKGRIDDSNIVMNDEMVTYDGQDHSKDIQLSGTDVNDSVTMTVTNQDGEHVEEAIEPGTYKVTATIQREYYEDATKTATLTIKEKDADKNEWTTPLTISSDDITYGDDYDVKAVSQYGDVTYTYQDEDGYTSSEKPTQAGTYTVIASVEGTDQYTSLKAEKRFTIKLKKVSIPDVTTRFVYDGNMHQICEYGAHYYISNASESDAGSYSSKLILYDNYEWEDGTTSDKEYSWTIEKASNKITENNVYDMTYGDDPGAKVRLKYNDDQKVISYRKIEESDYHSDLPDSAGSYVMKITCKGNQNIEDFTDYIYFTVKRAPNTWVQTLPYGKVFSYGEDYQMTAKAAHGDVTYTYYDYYGRLLNHKPTDVGTYTIKASGEGTDQYEPIKDEETFEIQPKKVAIPQPVTFIYDGNTHSISETEAYSVSGSATEPGEYTATLHLKNNNNYCWEDETISDQEVTYKIVKSSDKISLDQSILENGQLILPDNNYPYDLSKYVKDKEAELTFSSDDESVVSCQDGKLNTKNKGTANITVKDDDDVKITIPVKVISHIVHIPEGKTLTYNGKVQKGFDLPEGAEYDEPGKPEGPVATNAGQYYYYIKLKDGYIWDNGSTANQHITWSIEKADNEAKSFDAEDVTYPDQPNVHVELKYFDDDKKVEYKKEDASDNDYSTTMPTEPGTYDIRVTCQGSDNINAFERVKTFTIFSGTMDISDFNFEDMNILYDGHEHRDDLKVTGVQDDDEVSYEITDVNDEEVTSVKEPGTYYYEAKVHRKNYDDEYLYATLTISQHTNEWLTPIYGSSDDIRYGDHYDFYAVSQQGNVEYSYEDEYGDELYDQPTEAGNYKVIATVEATAQYTGLHAEKTFTIKPKKVAVPKSQTFTYDGQEHTIDASEGIYVDSFAVNAGTYSAEVSLENDNYIWNDDTNETKIISYTIKPKEVAIPDSQTFTYDGQEHTISASDEVNVENSSADIGTHYAKVSLKNDNYIWNDGTSDPKEIAYTIVKKETSEQIADQGKNEQSGENQSHSSGDQGKTEQPKQPNINEGTTQPQTQKTNNASMLTPSPVPALNPKPAPQDTIKQNEQKIIDQVTSLTLPELPQSTYQKMMVKQGKTSSTSVKVQWKKVKNAMEYLVFGTTPRKKYKKLGTVKKTSYINKKLKKNSYHQYMVVAVDSHGQKLASSKAIYVKTGKSVTKIKTVKTLKVKKGKSVKVKASLKGKIKVYRKIKLESSNSKIAKVKGMKVEGIKKGKCVVYAYAQNGTCVKIKVTVK